MTSFFPPLHERAPSARWVPSLCIGRIQSINTVPREKRCLASCIQGWYLYYMHECKWLDRS